MPETLDIRMAVPSEVDRLAELARRTFIDTFAEHNTAEDMAKYVDEAFSRDQLLSELEDSASTFIWAERTGIPAGYAKLRRGTDRACVTGPKPVELERMYAETDQIGAGVGKTLLHMAIKICQSEGFQTMWLGVWESNDRAIEFYCRQGFFEVGKQDFMLGNDRQTDLIMQLDLRC
jgi:ribosomal protein S18 acetylase RimI-like enzyme